MGTTVRMKAQKRQQAFLASAEDAEYTRKLEQAMMELEDAVYQVLGSDKGTNFHDVDFLYWSRKLKNTATQISMALNESSGPRRFHYHYRHDPNDYETLYPVAGPSPLDTLARVCREALTQCIEMVGMQDGHALSLRNRLEQSLRIFLSRHQLRPAGELKGN